MLQLSKNIGWIVMTLFALLLCYTTAQYLTFEPNINFLIVKEELIFDAVWRPTFYIHVISAMIVILVGPFQFIKNLRNKNLRLHKMLGKIYAYGILAFAAPTGLIMAFYAEGGQPSTIAFLIMGGLWFYTTIMAIIKVKQKNITEHQKWMYRSFALSFAAVTLRVLVPLMSLSNSFKEETVIVATAWLSWILNLIFIEIFIYYKFRNNHQPIKT
ncbi:MAG: putative membrane protein [Arenicella sp.]|jgi:uncharacterized membrane protein